MYSAKLGIPEAEFWCQVTKAVESANVKDDTAKRLDKLDRDFIDHCTRQEYAFKEISNAQKETQDAVFKIGETVEKVSKRISILPDMVAVENYVDRHYAKKETQWLKEKLEDARKREESQQFYVEHPTPQSGVRAVKIPPHKNPYVTIPTGITGLGAVIYIIVEFIVKYNGAG